MRFVRELVIWAKDHANTVVCKVSFYEVQKFAPICKVLEYIDKVNRIVFPPRLKALISDIIWVSPLSIIEILLLGNHPKSYG